MRFEKEWNVCKAVGKALIAFAAVTYAPIESHQVSLFLLFVLVFK